MSYSSEHIQIMDMRFSAHVTVAEFEQWLSQVERFFLKNRTLFWSCKPKSVRNFLRNTVNCKRFGTKNTNNFFQYCLGLVRIAQDPTDQQRLNTPSLHAAWRVPYYVTLDHSDALQWAVQRWICKT